MQKSNCKARSGGARGRGGGEAEGGRERIEKWGRAPPKKENRFGRGSLGVSGSTGERGQATDVGGGTSTQERNQNERKRREACGHTRRSVATRTGAKC